MPKVIITAALTGSIHTPSMSPYLPYKPDHMVDEAVRCHQAGAAVVHIHGRDPENGRQTADIDIFRESYHDS